MSLVQWAQPEMQIDFPTGCSVCDDRGLPTDRARPGSGDLQVVGQASRLLDPGRLAATQHRIAFIERALVDG